VWTYIRAIERSGLEGSDESKVPRTRRTPLTCPKRGAAVTAMTRATATTEATMVVTVTAARATATVVTAREAVAAARPVAKRHWLKY
jgi:hypothetical protein